MTPLEQLLQPLIHAPTPQGLWQLRAAVLQSGRHLSPPGDELLTHFYTFLTELTSRATAREYSHLASMLDMGAVGVVAVQNIVHAEGGQETWRRLLLGAFSEGLMVLAARQYVKAWEGEIQAVYQSTAWHLYAALWHTSLTFQPELAADKRRELIEKLLAPIHDARVNGTTKALLLARLFQVLLLVHLSAETTAAEA